LTTNCQAEHARSTTSDSEIFSSMVTGRSQPSRAKTFNHCVDSFPTFIPHSIVKQRGLYRPRPLGRRRTAAIEEIDDEIGVHEACDYGIGFRAAIVLPRRAYSLLR